MTTEVNFNQQQRATAILLKDIHAAILERAEWWRVNPNDQHQLNTAVYVSMLEVANAINTLIEERKEK